MKGWVDLLVNTPQPGIEPTATPKRLRHQAMRYFDRTFFTRSVIFSRQSAIQVRCSTWLTVGLVAVWREDGPACRKNEGRGDRKLNGWRGGERGSEWKARSDCSYCQLVQLCEFVTVSSVDHHSLSLWTTSVRRRAVVYCTSAVQLGATSLGLRCTHYEYHTGVLCMYICLLPIRLVRT